MDLTNEEKLYSASGRLWDAEKSFHDIDRDKIDKDVILQVYADVMVSINFLNDFFAPYVGRSED